MFKCKCKGTADEMVIHIVCKFSEKLSDGALKGQKEGYLLHY